MELDQGDDPAAEGADRGDDLERGAHGAWLVPEDGRDGILAVCLWASAVDRAG